jgi:flagellar assembly protein FliH
MLSADSTRLIKARSQRSVGTTTAFNFDDLHRQCDEYVAKSRQQGEQLLAEAAAEAEEIRCQAHAEGLAAGRRDGMLSAEAAIEARAAEIATAQTEERLKSALPAIREAVQLLHLERDQLLTTWETAAVTLAAAIAEKIVRRELLQQPALRVDMIREALRLAAGQPHVRHRLHPLDLTMLETHAPDVLRQLAASQAEFVADDSIALGGCVIESRHGSIDARLETQLARITEELLNAA